MFESKSYEEIMGEMLAMMPCDVDTSEGSLIYHACAKQAMYLEEAYLNLERVEDNMYLSTMDEEHLVLYGEDKGITRKAATNAVILARFKQEIETGTRFYAGDMNYTVLEKVTGYDYKILCDTPGRVGNTFSTEDELDTVDYVEDYQGGTLVSLLTAGTEEEDAEVYRARLIQERQGSYYGGNKEDYQRFIKNQNGVGACKVKRRTIEDTNIYPYILTDSYSIPGSGLIDQLQTVIDPVQNHGEGEGIAPIGHTVIIKAAVAKEINISSNITYDTGYSQEDVQSQMNTEVDRYFLELAKEWENTESMIVRIAQIEARLLSITGIIDISETMLNGTAENIILGYEYIPVRGTVHGV